MVPHLLYQQYLEYQEVQLLLGLTPVLVCFSTVLPRRL